MNSNLFRISMPYGIKGNDEIGWYIFNREYLPLGETKLNRIQPNYIKFKNATKIFEKLVECGCTKNLFNEAGLIHAKIFLYNDSTNPFVERVDKQINKVNKENYFKKLELIAKLQITNN